MISAHARFSECVDLSERHRLRRNEAANRSMMAFTRWFAAGARQALADACDAIAAAARIGHLRARMVAHHAAWFCRHELMGLDAAGEHAEAALSLSRQLGAQRFDAEALAMRAELHRLAGRAAETSVTSPASSPNSVRKLLGKLGFSRQSNRKADEGPRHPDRDAQFEHINTKVLAAQAAGEPVISVDTKKKELIGEYKNGGTDYRPKGDPRRVQVHDFEDKTLGKVAPYGVYDVTANEGWVSVGITADTAQFAVQSIRTWLERMGRDRYPEAKKLVITADCGGSNGARVKLWKAELQKLADETRLTLEVHHYPPGTSKWNKIEHRLFCHITQNWRGRPLTDRLAAVELIGATTTRAGLRVECALDERTYEKGVKVSKAEMAALDIEGDEFHPEWNYTIKPRHMET